MHDLPESSRQRFLTSPSVNRHRLRLAVTSNGHRAGRGREVRFEDAIITIAEFRRIALSMPEASEGAHMGHPDFRVKGKIFATLFWRDED